MVVASATMHAIRTTVGLVPGLDVISALLRRKSMAAGSILARWPAAVLKTASRFGGDSVEAISDATYADDEHWRVRIDFNLAAERGEVRVDVAVSHMDVASPHLVE